MRKSLLAILAILALNSLSAQEFRQNILKTNWMVGGRTMFSSQSQDYGTETYKRTAFSFSPNVGYFAWDKLALGARFSYDIENVKIGSTEDKETDLLFMPWVRYYFLQPVKPINIYGEVFYGMGSSKSNDDDAEGISKYGLEAGLSWFCNERVALDFFTGYRRSKFEEDDDWASTIYLGIAFQIFLDRCGPRKVETISKAR